MHRWTHCTLTLPLLASCALLGEEPSLDRQPVPDRIVAPWRSVPLEICRGQSCSDHDPAVFSTDIHWDGVTWQAVARVNDDLVLGSLVQFAWALELNSIPALSGVTGSGGEPRAPDWLVDGADTWVVHGVQDGSELRFAEVVGSTMVDQGSLFTAADAGATTISSPSAVMFDGQVIVAFAADTDRVMIASGLTLDTLATPTQAFGIGDVESSLWHTIREVGDPYLRVTRDGILQLFFVAEGIESELGLGSPAPNRSIGYAASADATTFEVFDANPVHNQTFFYIQQAHETHPAVGFNGLLGVMLYQEARNNLPSPALAIHEP